MIRKQRTPENKHRQHPLIFNPRFQEKHITSSIAIQSKQMVRAKYERSGTMTSYDFIWLTQNFSSEDLWSPWFLTLIHQVALLLWIFGVASEEMPPPPPVTKQVRPPNLPSRAQRTARTPTAPSRASPKCQNLSHVGLFVLLQIQHSLFCIVIATGNSPFDVHSLLLLLL